MKRNLLKNMTAALAALFAIAIALPQTAQAQEIRILGTDYSESAVLNLEGGGSIKWDEENATLTLNNVTLENAEKSLVFSFSPSGIKELKVVLEGKNSIYGANQEIFYWQDCDITIQGSGSLTARSTSNVAMYYSGDTPSTLTIKDCTLDIQSTYQSISGYKNGKNTVTLSLVVDNATLKVKGSTDGDWQMPGIDNLKAYELKNCHIETPAVKFGEVDEGWGYKLLGEDNDTYYGEVSIVPGNTTSITQPEASATATVQEIYSLDGRRQPRMQRDVNIVKMSDGTTRKVVCRQ